MDSFIDIEILNDGLDVTIHGKRTRNGQWHLRLLNGLPKVIALFYCLVILRQIVRVPPIFQFYKLFLIIVQTSFFHSYTFIHILFITRSSCLYALCISFYLLCKTRFIYVLFIIISCTNNEVPSCTSTYMHRYMYLNRVSLTVYITLYRTMFRLMTFTLVTLTCPNVRLLKVFLLILYYNQSVDKIFIITSNWSGFTPRLHFTGIVSNKCRLSEFYLPLSLNGYYRSSTEITECVSTIYYYSVTVFIIMLVLLFFVSIDMVSLSSSLQS